MTISATPNGTRDGAGSAASVATLVARDAPSTEVFESVATEVGKLLGTDMTVVGRYDGDGAATAIGSWSASGGGVPVGTRSAIGGHNVLTIVAETGKPARVDGYDDASGEAAEIARRFGWRSSIAAPIVVEGRVWGVMLVASQRPEPFPAGAEERLAAFTDLVATAVSNTRRDTRWSVLLPSRRPCGALRRSLHAEPNRRDLPCGAHESTSSSGPRQGRGPQVPRSPDGDSDGSLQCDRSSQLGARISSEPGFASIGCTRRVSGAVDRRPAAADVPEVVRLRASSRRSPVQSSSTAGSGG